MLTFGFMIRAPKLVLMLNKNDANLLLKKSILIGDTVSYLT